MQELIIFIYIGISVFMAKGTIIEEMERHNDLGRAILKSFATLLLWPLYIILILSHIAWEKVTKTK